MLSYPFPGYASVYCGSGSECDVVHSDDIYSPQLELHDNGRLYTFEEGMGPVCHRC